MLQNSHFHLFMFKIERSECLRHRGNATEASPGLKIEHYINKTTHINTEKDDKSSREASISAILSELATEFLLSNVWEGEFMQLKLEASAVSWRESLARLASARMRVRVTVSCLLYTSPSPRD